MGCFSPETIANTKVTVIHLQLSWKGFMFWFFKFWSLGVVYAVFHGGFCCVALLALNIWAQAALRHSCQCLGL